LEALPEPESPGSLGTGFGDRSEDKGAPQHPEPHAEHDSGKEPVAVGEPAAAGGRGLPAVRARLR
jgi:hypothetical protein